MRITSRRRNRVVLHQLRDRRIRVAGFAQSSPECVPQVVPVQVIDPGLVARPALSAIDSKVPAGISYARILVIPANERLIRWPHITVRHLLKLAEASLR